MSEAWSSEELHIDEVGEVSAAYADLKAYHPRTKKM
jgi:hypothetical protein